MKKYDIIVLSGGFEPFSVHHINLIAAAKELAYKVIVGINSDEWLLRNKGIAVNTFKERSILIKSIKGVDEVMRFNDRDNTAIELLTRVHRLYPDCSIAFGNGGGWKEEDLPEKGFCHAYNIDMIYDLGK